MAFLTLDARPPAGTAHVVATLGPRSLGRAAALAANGATAFRLNASHLRVDALARALEELRRSCPGAPVVVDLQGAKMRLGPIAPRTVALGERVRFSLHPSSGIELPHPELYRQLATGDVLGVDDGRLRLEVVQAGNESFEARALGPGDLAPRKGVTVEQHPIRLEGLTASDVDAIEVASRHGVQTYAFSFMKDGTEATWVRARVPGAIIAGKVEREEAVRRLPALAARVNTVWICRGDLGAQLGPGGLVRAVAAVRPPEYPVPVLMAGQVLQHLVHHAEPTRSEVCHLHDLLVRGYAGIVLSDETALGTDPVRAVAAASSLVQALTLPGPAAPRWT